MPTACEKLAVSQTLLQNDVTIHSPEIRYELSWVMWLESLSGNFPMRTVVEQSRGKQSGVMVTIVADERCGGNESGNDVWDRSRDEQADNKAQSSTARKPLSKKKEIPHSRTKNGRKIGTAGHLKSRLHAFVEDELRDGQDLY